MNYNKLNRQLFTSLLESEVERCNAESCAKDDIFDSIFASLDDKSELAGSITELEDGNVADIIDTQSSDAKNVKVAVKDNDEEGVTESYVTLEEFASFCYYSGLGIKAAANAICEENSDDEIELHPANMSIVIRKDALGDPYTKNFADKIMLNGINVCTYEKSSKTLADAVEDEEECC